GGVGAARVRVPLGPRADFKKLIADLSAQQALTAARHHISQGNDALNLGQAREADAHYRQALSLLEPLAGARTPSYRQARAAALLGLGRLQHLTRCPGPGAPSVPTA